MNRNLVAKNWQDYECIDTGNGEKLERWKDVILRRPDPQAIWPMEKEDTLWQKPHAHYHRSNKGGGNWEYIKKVKDSINKRTHGKTVHVRYQENKKRDLQI